MMSRFWVLASTMVVAAACSSAQQSQFNQQVTGGDENGDQSSDDGGGSGGSSGQGSSSGQNQSSGGQELVLDSGIDARVIKGQYSDAAAQKFYDTSIPDAELATSVSMTITPFVVKAGDEVYMCQWFANPFGGNDVDIVEIDGQMSQGSHHFFVFDMQPSTGQTTASPETACPAAGLEFFPYIYLSQQPNWDVTYPQADMAYPLAGQDGLMMNVHFLNASTEDIQATATVTIRTANPTDIKTYVGNLFLNNQAIAVPPTPMTSPPYAVTASATPPIPYDYYLLQSWSHMHQYGTNFTASVAGTQVYQTTNWNNPPVFNHSPPISVPQGSAFSWTCDYYNPTLSTMYFGDSAATDDMCIYFGQFYPALSIANGGPDYVNVITGL
jgi:hypothetical protein